MKIVVTDGFTVNDGDLSWEGLATLGELTVYDRTPLRLLEERCRNATVVLTNKTPFSKETIDALPDLRCLVVLATGYNVIDVTAATQKGIVVCNVPGYGTASVARHVFSLVLALTNAVEEHNQSVKNGDWQRSADWCYTLQPIIELKGKIIGLVGYGNIGQQVARIAAAFDMKVLFYNPSPKPSAVGLQTSLEDILQNSDFISLHCPLTEANKHFVNRAFLRQMKRSAFLINTARGPLIHEQDLADALNEGLIAGAALDVLETEPPTQKQVPLLQAKNCLLTPHNAWMSREARERIITITKANIVAFLNGYPINRVG